MRGKIICSILIIFIAPLLGTKSLHGNQDKNTNPSILLPKLSASQIHAFSVSQINGILNEKDNDLRHKRFRNFFKMVEGESKKFRDKLSELYLEIYNLEEKKNMNDVEKSKYAELRRQVADIQQIYNEWVDIEVAFTKVANLFIYERDRDVLNCQTIEAEISKGYLLNAPPGTKLLELPQLAIKLSKALCDR